MGADNQTERVIARIEERERKMTERTFGQKAVGLDFNPSNSVLVQEIKETFAGVIDLLNDACALTNDEAVKRMYSVAITDAQTAQMWGVKAATWRE